MTGRTSPLETHPELARLAAAQCGVVSRAQLATLEITRHHIRSQVVAQRWRPIGPHAVVLHTGPISRAQWRWTAVLHSGTGARLAGLSALEQDGLTGWARDETHVLVASGRSVPPLVGLIVHTTRLSDVDSGSSGHRPASAGPQVGWPKVRQGGTPRFASEQLETGLPASWGDASVPGRCPATPVVRSTVDAARWESSSRRAGGIVLAVVQQRLATPSQLGECVDRLGRVRNSRAISRALVDAAAGADSLAEADVARLVLRAGLPAPRAQVVVETADGPRRVDLVVDLPDGRLLAIEVDGVHHARTEVRLADASKDAALVAAGHQVLRIPVQALRIDRGRVLRQLAMIREASARRRRSTG